MTVREKIEAGRTFLGIELGSTRIKAVLTDDSYVPIASGSHSWENRFENGYWTYSLDDIRRGLQSCYASLAENVSEQYGAELKTFGAMGVSAMMHGYMPFDKDGGLLVPFRTWRNTTTEKAAEELTELFGFNIPQRWSIAHFYQAVLNGEEHLGKLYRINTLAGYIHFLLTERFEVGAGEASGIFPLDGIAYNGRFIELINNSLKRKGFDIDVRNILPKVRNAGEKGAFLTEAGAHFLDPSGRLEAGIPVCPPEGDAGTGMTATNSVSPGTGNVSAGTSIFSMLVLDKQLKGVYPQIDSVTTPDGLPVAMVHCNNCCSELDSWVNMFAEFARLCSADIDISKVYSLLYNNALKGESGCGGITVYNFISGEPAAGLEKGCPMYIRRPEARLDLANFFKAQLYTAAASLKLGMDILYNSEGVKAERITGHGGLFKVEGVAQQFIADALKAPVSVMKTAGEGGAWGMALLSAFMNCGEGRTLAKFLEQEVFVSMEEKTVYPDVGGSESFEKYMAGFKAGLEAEKAAADALI